MTEPTIEALARAMYAASGSPLAWDETWAPEQRWYRALGAAAVLALADDVLLATTKTTTAARAAKKRLWALIDEARATEETDGDD